MNMMFENDVKAVEALQNKFGLLKSEISKRIVGQEQVVDDILISIFSRGHALLVGVPGLAKTMLIQTLSEVLDLKFSRIQFTPDLMPSDIIGSEILDQNRQFQFIKGPIFANVVLADEINRTPPKTQSALLEAMQEKSITVAGKSYAIGNPFFVLATQNPIEQEGTYPLPEAQLDRFMFQIKVDYPNFSEEVEIVKSTTQDRVKPIVSQMTEEEILYFQGLVRRIPVPDALYEYVVKLVASTRIGTADAHDICKKYLAWGAGPRASQYLIIGAKCHAALRGKFSPDKEDVRAVALQVLRHRLVKNYKAESEGLTMDGIIEGLL